MESPMHNTASRSSLFLFGDQTENVLPPIQHIYQCAPSSFYLQHFLRIASDTARHSIEEFSTAAGRTKFSFDSFLSLAEQSASARACPDVVVQTLLLCVAQLGQLIL